MKVVHPRTGEPVYPDVPAEDVAAMRRTWATMAPLLARLGARRAGWVACPYCGCPHPRMVHDTYCCGFCGDLFRVHRDNFGPRQR